MKLRTKLLVCVDKTEHSKTAVHFACARAKRINCLVEIIHVINPSHYTTLFAVGEKIKQEIRKEAESLLSSMAEEAYKFAGITPSIIIKEGLISEEIIKVVQSDANFNMLVIGKSPQESTKTDMISMLTSELASKIMIPIMIVPGNLNNNQINELA